MPYLVLESTTGAKGAQTHDGVFYETLHEAEQDYSGRTTGNVKLYDLAAHPAVHGNDFTIRHYDNANSLDKMDSQKLRAEAKSRGLASAGNPTSSDSEIRHEIQQHDLARRAQLPVVRPFAPAADRRPSPATKKDKFSHV